MLSRKCGETVAVIWMRPVTSRQRASMSLHDRGHDGEAQADMGANRQEPMLSRREKLLYHQIHPLKLAVDITSSLASTWLLWRHELLWGLLVAWAPSVAVTVAMVRWMDFTRQRDSTFGRYVAHHMTRLAEAVRLGGQFGMWFGAWFHSAWAIAAGVVVIILGWTYSLPLRRSRIR